MALIAFIVILGVRPIMKQLGVPAPLGSGIALFGLWVGWYFWIWVPIEQRVLRREILAMDVCVVCGYELKNLQRSQDGCVECPECGAAWCLKPKSPVLGE